MNHKLVSWILVTFAIVSIILTTILRFFNCGNGCDPVANVIFADLYGRILPEKKCPPSMTFPFVIPALILVYMLIVILECRRKNLVIVPGLRQPLRFQQRLSAEDGGHANNERVAIPSVSGQIHSGSAPRHQPQQAWINLHSDAASSPEWSAAENSFLTKLILKTGGVTILAFLSFAMFGLVVQKVTWLLMAFMKLSCMKTHLAWYMFFCGGEQSRKNC